MLISFNTIKYMIALIRYFSAIWCLLSTSDVNLHLPAMLRAFTRLATSRSSHHYLTNETFHLRLYVQIVTAHRKMYVLDLPDLRRRRSINWPRLRSRSGEKWVSLDPARSKTPRIQWKFGAFQWRNHIQERLRSGQI